MQVVRTEPKRQSNGVENMVRALNILTNISVEKFHEFCEATNMPSGDREAVWFKHQGRFPDPKQLATGIG